MFNKSVKTCNEHKGASYNSMHSKTVKTGIKHKGTSYKNMHCKSVKTGTYCIMALHIKHALYNGKNVEKFHST